MGIHLLIDYTVQHNMLREKASKVQIRDGRFDALHFQTEEEDGVEKQTTITCIHRNDHNICISQNMLGCCSNNTDHHWTRLYISRNMRLRSPKNSVLVFILFLVLVVKNTKSINCYECTSSQGTECVYSATSCQYGFFGCVKIAVLSGGVDKSMPLCFWNIKNEYQIGWKTQLFDVLENMQGPM